MSEPVQLAKSARELLAAALNALQSNGAVPPELEALAEPIAQAMSIMHRIERSGGQTLDGCDIALGHVRDVLNRLQTLTLADPVIDVLMEHVASSLSKVHALTRARAAAVMAPAAVPVVPVAAPAPVPVAAPAPASPRHVQQPAPAPSPRAASPAAAALHAPQQPAGPRAPHPSPPTAVIDVELGALTPSNFYRGLGGNDVVEHGGIFVATYKIPKIGTPVSLRVRLPGNYEFSATALVQWTREAGGSGDSAEPGFGARITHISAEGRQLIHRYTRNREPLFYDDP